MRALARALAIAVFLPFDLTGQAPPATPEGVVRQFFRAERDGRWLDAARLLVTQYLGQQPHIMLASGVPQSLLDVAIDAVVANV